MAGREATAGEMLAEIVDDLAARIVDRGPAALADEPDAVHQLRTAVRRLRNVLAAFGQYVEPAAVGRLPARLTDYSDRLGQARDLEVRAQWCATFAAEVGLSAELEARLVGPLEEAHARAHLALVAWSRSGEAEELQSALCAWVHTPALPSGSARPAAAVAREVVAAQADRVLAHGADDYDGDPEAAHALRKAGRRLRHAADAVTQPPGSVLGSDAAELGDLGSRLQSLLGDHRDALLLADYVRGSLPDDADARAPYATVIEAAERAAEAAIAGVPEVLEKLQGTVRGA
jgi:CHAD domain-containing protein